MNDILELVIIVVIAVAGFTIIYKLLPFRIWKNKKPKFTLFPKYVTKFDKPVSEIESALEKLQFKNISNRIFTRGKVYGDFSAKAVKLSAEVDEENSQIKIYASFFGILFDTGEIWQVTSDIINEQKP